MPLSNEVHKFTSACEHLIAGMAMYRPLTEDERLLIKHYCNEVLTKVDQPQTNSAQVEIPLSPMSYHAGRKNPGRSGHSR